LLKDHNYFCTCPKDLELHAMRTYLLILFTLLIANAVAQNEERYFRGNTTPTWQETVDTYRNLAKMHPQTKLHEIGYSDGGKPLHLFVINKNGTLEWDQLAMQDKPILLVNNAIHPGEPCGVDASIALCQLLLDPQSKYAHLLDSAVVCILPMYNIGGALNRGCCSRANQNGPEQYGFRGNERNLDLNRDFIKCDSQNARAFNQMFSRLNPHLFVDTHTSNGADYQYTMTMISTQPDKAGPVIGSYMKNTIDPWLYNRMKERNWEMIPYVESINKIPDNGIYGFLETPRYATGYAALFNTIAYTSEAHMLKPYEDRVEATLHFLLSLLEFTNANAQEIIVNKAKADKQVQEAQQLPLRWQLDTTVYQSIEFKGYEAEYEKSEVSGALRLKYNRQKPYTKSIKLYNKHTITLSSTIPEYYIVPQAWREVLERLSLNGVEMTSFKSDTLVFAETYYIEDFSSPSQPYEGHYIHHEVACKRVLLNIHVLAGDYLISTHQAKRRYIVESLEPQGMDSFFTWNFFDSMLQQKEWFSDYVFEEEAAQMLQNDPALKSQLEELKLRDPAFAQSNWAQLYYLYQQSKNFEISMNRYPVLRYMP